MTLVSPSLTLELKADIGWIPVIQGLIETGAPLLGLDEGKTIRLSMSAEELIVYLARSSKGTGVRITLSRKSSQVTADFCFQASMSDLWAMNLTSAGEITADQGMDNMGLFLASRMVDTFCVGLNHGQITISLSQEIVYPAITPLHPDNKKLRGKILTRFDAEPADIAQACALALACYPEDQRPDFFLTPGTLIDRIAEGTTTTAIIKDETGTFAGMICWEWSSDKSIGFYGPYVFNTPSEGESCARILTDQMISSIARTPAMIVYSIQATRDLPSGDFENLATLDLIRQDQKLEKRTLWFRHLREDMGLNVWSHPSMVKFLEASYQRLFLMRTINETMEQGQRRPERSLFAAELYTGRKEAVLRPLVDGSDIKENIIQHVNLLREEGYTTLFFSIDLAFGWQASMGGSLMENGFIPAFVLPYAGDADKVIFQYVDTAS